MSDQSQKPPPKAQTQPSIDFEAEGLCDGLTDPRARKARLDLLKELHASGVSLAELRRALDEGRLAFLPTERELAGEAKYTVAEIAERSGIDLETLKTQRRATGLPVPEPNERAFSEEDLWAAQAFKQFVDAGLPLQGLIESARVFGLAASQAAGAARTLVGDALLMPGDTERDVGLRYAQAARTLDAQTAQTLQYLFRAHLLQQLRNVVLDEATLSSGELLGAQTTAVCFADLADFTRLGETIPPDELGSIANRLTALVTENIQPPVRLVKTIGDAAMLVCVQPAPLLETALSLVEAADAQGEDFPGLRVGISLGSALERWGDWYGSAVNLADRLTTIARPSSVLVTKPFREAVGDDYRWSYAGRKKFKGISGQTVIFRARRPS
jgi:adenylate cyclase